MICRSPVSKRTDTLAPSTPLFRAIAKAAWPIRAAQDPGRRGQYPARCTFPGFTGADTGRQLMSAKCLARKVGGNVGKPDKGHQRHQKPGASLYKHLSQGQPYCQYGSDTEQAKPYPTRAALRLPLERSEEHTSELQSLMRISYAVCC